MIHLTAGCCVAYSQSTARVFGRVLASLPLTSDHYCRPTVTTGHPPDWHNHKPGYPGLEAVKPVNPGLKNTARVCISYSWRTGTRLVRARRLIVSLLVRVATVVKHRELMLAQTTYYVVNYSHSSPRDEPPIFIIGCVTESRDKPRPARPLRRQHWPIICQLAGMWKRGSCLATQHDDE